MQLGTCEISQMARGRLLWEISPMAKVEAPPGVSAKLIDLLMSAKPDELSERQWCMKAQVSTSFFTDLRNGREPGIDKVERMAGAIGLSLSEFLAGQRPPIRLVPEAEELEQMLSEIVGDEITMQTRPSDLPRIFGTALHGQLKHYRSGLASPKKEKAPVLGAAAQSPAPTRRSVQEGSRKT